MNEWMNECFICSSLFARMRIYHHLHRMSDIIIITFFRLTWGCVPLQPVHTSLPPVSPVSGLSGSTYVGPAELRRCPQTRTPECGGTSVLGGHLLPLQTRWPGFGACLMMLDRMVWGSLAERLPERPPGVWPQWSSRSLCLKAGGSVPPTRSSLWGGKRHFNTNRLKFCNLIT